MIRNRLGSRTMRLHLEHLEDRSVPSTFTVNTTLDSVVPGDGKLSLREAITKANTAPGADVIVVPAGVFKIGIPIAGEDANAIGDFDITDAVTIQGAGAGKTVVDGQQLDRVFDIDGTGPSSIKVILQGVTIRNGKVSDNGGGIRTANADLAVRDCIVTGNRASAFGGGISNWGPPDVWKVTLIRSTFRRNVSNDGGGVFLTSFNAGDVTIQDCKIQHNIASNRGGGLYCFVVTLTNCSVQGNMAAGELGGGIYTGKATLKNCTISGNYAFLDGGGVKGSILTATNCTFSGNSTAANGGGVNLEDDSTLTNCTFSGNFATGDGGGIYTFQPIALINCTVSGNNAAGDGGGLWLRSASLLNCTVVENSGHTGGGLFHDPLAPCEVRNTIVALNLVDLGGAGPNVSGNYTSQGHNFIGDVTGGNGFTNGVKGDIVGSAASPIDPKLGPLANNGGKTKTHALLAGSPAIDRGDNSVVNPVTGLPVTTDQRGFGFARRKDGNGDGSAIVDIGAFEK